MPSGGGFEVLFCQTGRSSNILKVYSKQLDQLASSGHISAQVLADTQNVTLQRINSMGNFSSMPMALSTMMAVMLAVWLWA